MILFTKGFANTDKNILEKLNKAVLDQFGYSFFNHDYLTIIELIYNYKINDQEIFSNLRKLIKATIANNYYRQAMDTGSLRTSYFDEKASYFNYSLITIARMIEDSLGPNLHTISEQKYIQNIEAVFGAIKRHKFIFFENEDSKLEYAKFLFFVLNPNKKYFPNFKNLTDDIDSMQKEILATKPKY